MSAQPDPSPPRALPLGYCLLWYRIDQVLRQGSHGITYLCHDLKAKHPVILKEYAPAEYVQRGAGEKLYLRSESAWPTFNRKLMRVLSAAEDLGGFAHPNVTWVIDLFEANNTAYVVTSYAAGQDLESMDATRPVWLSETELVHLVEPMIDGVEKLHGRGLLHSRISSEHIVVGQDQRGVLLDLFSIGAAVEGPEPSGGERNARKRCSPDFGIDIYAIGRLLYVLVVRSLPPSTGGSALHALHDAGYREPLAQHATRYYSKAFLEAIDHALVPAPAARPPTVQAWRRELGLTQSSVPSATIRWPAELSEAEPNAPQPSAPAIEQGDTLPAPLDDELFTLATREVIASGAIRQRPGHTESRPAPRARVRRALGKRLVLGATMVAAFGLVAYFNHPWGGSRLGLVQSASTSKSPTVPEPETVARTAALVAQAPPLDARKPLAQATPPVFKLPAASSDRLHAVHIEALLRGEERVQPRPAALESPIARIETLLRQAEEDIASKRLTRPSDSSALEKYRAVLALDPGNSDAARGMRRIVRDYVDWAYACIRSNRLGCAGRYLARAASIAPDSSMIHGAYEAAAAKRKALQAARAARAARLDYEREPRTGAPEEPSQGSQPKQRAPAPFEEFLMRIGEG